MNARLFSWPSGIIRHNLFRSPDYVVIEQQLKVVPNEFGIA